MIKRSSASIESIITPQQAFFQSMLKENPHLMLAETTMSPIFYILGPVEQHDEEKNDSNVDEGDGFNYITNCNNN
jgi:hypothetical protein